MNKIVLLFAMLCMGTLNGMKNLQRFYVDVPQEVQLQIISNLPICGDLDHIVYAVNAVNLTDKLFNKMVQQVYGNQLGFTKMVHILAHRLNKSTEAIAIKFATPTSKRYITLFDELNAALSRNIFYVTRKILLIIDDGVDVNYTSGNPDQLPALFLAVELGAWPDTLKTIELLLAHGANIHATHPKEGTILKYAAYILFAKHGFQGYEQRKIMDDMFRFLINTYYSSSKDERKKIKKEYQQRRCLLSKSERENIKEAIEREKAKRKAKLTQ